MQSIVSRRKFLGHAAALGTAALLPAAAEGLTGSNMNSGPTTDVANRNLTTAAVAKVEWKAEPFSMTDVRLLPGFWKDMMELNRSLALFATQRSPGP